MNRSTVRNDRCMGKRRRVEIIEFKNVNFTYPDAKTQALNDVSFKIEAGEKIVWS